MSEISSLPDVTIYAGPMASGKTKALHSLIGEFQKTNLLFEPYKPSLDIRESGIKPRGVSEADAYECEAVDALADIDAEALACRGIKTVLLEEFHMFGYKPDRTADNDIYLPLMTNWAAAGIETVYAAGLDLSAHGQQFSIFTDAHRFGAKIILFSARCEYPVSDDGPTCRAEAHNSQIFSVSQGKAYQIDSLPDLLPEGDDPDRSYRAVCANHFVLPKESTIDFID